VRSCRHDEAVRAASCHNSHRGESSQYITAQRFEHAATHSNTENTLIDLVYYIQDTFNEMAHYLFYPNVDAHHIIFHTNDRYASCYELA